MGGKKVCPDVKKAVELCKSIKKESQSGKKLPKYCDEFSKTMVRMKITLYGPELKGDSNPEAVAELIESIIAGDFFEEVLAVFLLLDFESRKDFGIIFNHCCRREIKNSIPIITYVQKSDKVTELLLKGYESPEVALITGSMLRVIFEDLEVVRKLINSALFYSFFKYVADANFDIASDAFSSFRDVLTRHKDLIAQYLEKNYDAFFDKYQGLLTEGNYVTRRQSLKLLSELLLDRSNFNVMTRYISDENNLKLMMTLLRDKSKNIQFEAFHVFKVFVANPKKADAILKILVLNKTRLLQFLDGFHNEKEDEQFADEKQFLMRQIEGLPNEV